MNVEAELQAIIKKQSGGKADGLAGETRLTEVGLDSIDLVEIVFEIEDKFHIHLPQNNEQMASATFADLVKLVERLIVESQALRSAQAT